MKPRIRLNDALHLLLVVGLLLLQLVQRLLQARREPVPLFAGRVQETLLPPEVFLVVAAGDLRLLDLDLVQLTLAVQEVLLEVLPLLVRVLKLMSKGFLLRVERLHVHAQPLQLLHVHLVGLLFVGRGPAGGEVLEPRLQDPPLLAELRQLRALRPGAAGQPRLTLCLELLDLSPHALYVALQRPVLPGHVVHLLLELVRVHGGHRRRTAVLELVVQALDDLREAADGLDQLGLELLLLIVRVPQHLLRDLLLLHRAVKLLYQALEEDAAIQALIGHSRQGTLAHRRAWHQGLDRQQSLEDASRGEVPLRVEAPNREGDEVPHRPAGCNEVERPRLVHDQLELCGVQGVDDDSRVLSAVLRDHLPGG
mmetsp:Transcript_39829/g.118098  ORF Transcript_39829/g.118098 Transcript_39829/m.118098 type:complete len:367 (-) Transcript_39829:364-1464(-)